MIAFVEGVLEEKEPTRVVILAGGIGYEVFIPLSSYDRLPPLRQTLRLLTVPVIREDAHLLYGFLTAEERETFLQLTAISGIGPKLALAVLSGLSVRELRAAVARSDFKRLSGITGIGRKTAERIVLELRDKLGKGDQLEALAGPAQPPAVAAKLRDALQALVSLGHKQTEAQRLIQQVAAEVTPETPLEDILRRVLSGRRPSP